MYAATCAARSPCINRALVAHQRWHYLKLTIKLMLSRSNWVSAAAKLLLMHLQRRAPPTARGRQRRTRPRRIRGRLSLTLVNGGSRTGGAGVSLLGSCPVWPDCSEITRRDEELLYAAGGRCQLLQPARGGGYFLCLPPGLD